MSDTPRVDELIAAWEEHIRNGQYIPPEELCEKEPELLSEVERRISEIEHSPEYETQMAESMDAGVVATAFEAQPAEKESSPGALVMNSSFVKLRFLARGGLGEVYVADDEKLQRDVALKFIRPKHCRNEALKRQFDLEAEITARLDHPGVVPVYGFGTTPDGRPCYAMRYIDGVTLEEKIARLHSGMRIDSVSTTADATEVSSQPKPGRKPDDSEFVWEVEFRSLLTRFLSVCQTIAYAHKRGILHRDLKPDNIMLGRYGDTLVVDWGLAIAVDRDRSDTDFDGETLMPMSGSKYGSSSHGPVGTPSYMSPEQAAGANLTRSADIFCLGAILYKLLTGQRPYEGDKRNEVLRKACLGLYKPVREVKPTAPKALAAICEKAMAPSPDDRYDSAMEIVDEVERWLADAKVEAHDEGFLDRTGRWVRRHRNLTMAIVASLSAIAVVVSIAAVGYSQAAMTAKAAEETANAAHVESLKLASQSVAQGMEKELLYNWELLRREAMDPSLIAIVKRLNEKPEDILDDGGDAQAQAWLTNLSTRTQEGVERIWIIDLYDGTQAARIPYSRGVGKNFAYRDYFNGIRGSRQGDGTDYKPLTGPFCSSVFRGKFDPRWMVALTVPIRELPKSGNASQSNLPVIGVLGMAFRLGQFDVIDDTRSQDKDRVVVLVDTNIDEDGKAGTILFDSRLGATEESAHVNAESLKELEQLSKAARKRLRTKSTIDEGGLETLKKYAYHDDPNGKWLAVGQPVVFERRLIPGEQLPADQADDDLGASTNMKMEDPGWVIIVQEKIGQDKSE